MKISMDTKTLKGALRLAPGLLALALSLVAATSRADAPAAKGVLSMRLVDLRSSAGKIGCLLYASEKGFPKDASSALQVKWCPIANKESTCAFDPIAAGTYAVVCIHDENENGKMDSSFFGIPTEGVVASNHAKGGMGPPSFKDAKFAFSGAATELRLTMGYY